MPPLLATSLILILGVALLLVLLRLLRGPTTADRVVALDLLTTLAVGYLAVHAVVTKQWMYLDIALGLGLVAFLGTIGFGVLVERQAEEDAASAASSPPPPTAASPSPTATEEKK